MATRNRLSILDVLVALILIGSGSLILDVLVALILVGSDLLSLDVFIDGLLRYTRNDVLSTGNDVADFFFLSN